MVCLRPKRTWKGHRKGIGEPVPSSWVRLWPAARGQGFSEASPLASQPSCVLPSWSQLLLQGPLSCLLSGARRGGPGVGGAWSTVAQATCCSLTLVTWGKAIHHCLGLRNSGEGNSSCPYLSLTQAWLPILEEEGNGVWRNSTFAQTEENSGPSRLRVYGAKLLWRNKPG